MPTYEYACTNCGQHVEVFQRISDEPMTVCGVCGGPLRKVFHPTGIVFKGSGFYSTDSRSSAKSGKEDKEPSESPSAAKADAKGEGESRGDSKGDSKGESKGESASGPKDEKKPAKPKEQSA